MSEKPPSVSQNSPDETLKIPPGPIKRFGAVSPKIKPFNPTVGIGNEREGEKSFLKGLEEAEKIRTYERRVGQLFTHHGITGEDAKIMWHFIDIRTGEEISIASVPESLSYLELTGITPTPKGAEVLAENGEK